MSETSNNSVQETVDNTPVKLLSFRDLLPLLTSCVCCVLVIILFTFLLLFTLDFINPEKDETTISSTTIERNL